MREALDFLFVAAAAFAVTLAGTVLAGAGAQARDFGAMGTTWGIIEPDLLSTIQGRLSTLEANGGVARMQAQLAATAERRARRPIAVGGLSPTIEPRRWAYDPSIVVEADVRDATGRQVVARGTRVNPLDFVALRQDLVFIDGDDVAQVRWATGRWSAAGAKLILVSGSPLDLMGAYRRRFYFDQRGSLTAKFGIAHVPAVIRGAGDHLAIEEVVVPAGSPS